MTVFHDEIEIEDMEFDEENQLYHYPCPCGDRFEIRYFFNLIILEFKCKLTQLTISLKACGYHTFETSKFC